MVCSHCTYGLLLLQQDRRNDTYDLGTVGRDVEQAVLVGSYVQRDRAFQVTSPGCRDRALLDHFQRSTQSVHFAAVTIVALLHLAGFQLARHEAGVVEHTFGR